MALTLWYYRLLANVLTLGKNEKVKDTKGNSRSYSKDVLASGYNIISNIQIGKSNEEFGIAQYKLSDPYATITELTISVVEVDNCPQIKIEATYTATEQVDIYEIGLFGKFAGYEVMIDRTVLPDKISLVPEQKLKITYLLKLV